MSSRRRRAMREAQRKDEAERQAKIDASGSLTDPRRRDGLPAGAYWSRRHGRYLTPTEPEWSAEAYEAVTGRPWEPIEPDDDDGGAPLPEPSAPETVHQTEEGSDAEAVESSAEANADAADANADGSAA